MESWQVAIAVAVTVMVLVTWYLVQTSINRQAFERQRAYERARQDRIAPEDHRNTIFVILPCLDSAIEASKALFSLFNEADCPWRVSAGVVHYKHEDNTGLVGGAGTREILDDVIGRYEQVCSNHGATSFAGRIRVMVRPYSEYSGAVVARALSEHLFEAERYVLFATEETRFLPHWDTTCLDMHAKCCGRSAHPILTTALHRTDDTSAIAAMVAPSPTFVAAAPHPSRFAQVRPVPFHNAKKRRLSEALLWSPEFTFAASKLLHQVPTDPNYVHGDEVDTVVHTARYLSHGWDLFLPTEVVAQRSVREKPAPKPDKETLQQRSKSVSRALALFRRDRCKVCDSPRDEHTPDHGLGHLFEPLHPDALSVHATHPLGQAMPIDEIEHRCGIRVGTAEIKPHALIGCLVDETEAEIINKFGCLEDHRVILRKAEQMVTGD